MAVYQYDHNNVDLAKLWQETLAAGLPVDSVNGGALGSAEVYVNTARDLTPAELLTLDDVVRRHDGRQRRPRPLLTIYTEIASLSPTDRLAIGNDLFGASAKWSLDVGANRGSIFVLYMLTQLGLTTGQTNVAKQGAAAMYVQDNPKYLVNPAFLPGVNIPGDEPIPAA